MTIEQRDKYAYELMVKNNPEEAVKQLLLKDKTISTINKLNQQNLEKRYLLQQKVDKSIEYIGNGNLGIPRKTREKFIKILKGEEVWMNITG